MTNRISFKPSFSDALGYCLRDKRVRQERKPERSEPEGRQMRNRAEVIYYHLCNGDLKELTRQFREVQKQDLNISKPAFCLSLSVAPEDKVSKGRFVEIAKACAKALDFERHQYVVVLHKDTAHPHIHLVVNRIGFDGHTMGHKYALELVLAFCREMERRYELKQLKNIYRYRSVEERMEQRTDPVTRRLKEEIEAALKEVHDLDGFRQRLGERGYKVYKNERGIAFVTSEGAKVQGNHADYPWKKIEAKLAKNLVQQQKLVREQERRMRPRIDLY